MKFKFPKQIHMPLMAFGVGIVVGAVFKTIVLLGVGVIALGAGIYAYRKYLK